MILYKQLKYAILEKSCSKKAMLIKIFNFFR